MAEDYPIFVSARPVDATSSKPSKNRQRRVSVPVSHMFNKVTILIPDETRKMSNHDLLHAIKDVELQRDDYGLAFDVESYELELRTEKYRRRI